MTAWNTSKEKFPDKWLEIVKEFELEKRLTFASEPPSLNLDQQKEWGAIVITCLKWYICLDASNTSKVE